MSDSRTPRYQGLISVPDGRRVGVCWDEKPRCVMGHRLRAKDPEAIRNVRIDLLVRCQWRDPKCPDAGPCDCLQIATRCHIPGTGERFWIVVEITDEQKAHLTQHPSIFLERMVLLGCALPGVEVDLNGQEEAA